MNINIDALLEESQDLASDMVNHLADLGLAEDLLRVAKADYGQAYGDFLAKEGEGLLPPGGGRWNDDKRAAYVATTWAPKVHIALRAAEQRVLTIERAIKVTAEYIAALNRKIRILQIAVADDTNAATLAGLRLTRI